VVERRRRASGAGGRFCATRIDAGAPRSDGFLRISPTPLTSLSSSDVDLCGACRRVIVATVRFERKRSRWRLDGTGLGWSCA